VWRQSPIGVHALLAPLLGAALCLPLIVAHAAGPTAPTDICDLHTDQRVVAIGDVHGAYEPFVAILREAGLIDARDRWIGGSALLVQTGDVLDRGPDSRRVIDLLRKLERSAARAGGGVYALLGNHELMRLTGDWRYVSAREVAAFRRGDSTGADEFRAAFAAAGGYGRWLISHAAIAKINGMIFVHGGVSPSVAPLGCRGINAAIETELDDLAAGRNLSTALGNDVSGPLWYRGLATEPEDSFASSVGTIFQNLDANGMVIGHTVSPGRITTRFAGRVVMIDTGMLGGELARDGTPSALEMRGTELTAIYLGGRREKLTTPQR
jgi:hypothetical protein